MEDDFDFENFPLKKDSVVDYIYYIDKDTKQIYFISKENFAKYLNYVNDSKKGIANKLDEYINSDSTELITIDYKDSSLKVILTDYYKKHNAFGFKINYQDKTIGDCFVCRKEDLKEEFFELVNKPEFYERLKNAIIEKSGYSCGFATKSGRAPEKDKTKGDSKVKDYKMENNKLNDAISTYYIKWIDTKAKANGKPKSEYWHVDQIKADSPKRALLEFSYKPEIADLGKFGCQIYNVYTKDKAFTNCSGYLYEIVHKPKNELGVYKNDLRTDSVKRNVYTVMYFAPRFGDWETWTGLIYADSEAEAREKFKKYCPHCKIDRVKPGILSYDSTFIGYDTEENIGVDGVSFEDSESKYLTEEEIDACRQIKKITEEQVKEAPVKVGQYEFVYDPSEEYGYDFYVANYDTGEVISSKSLDALKKAIKYNIYLDAKYRFDRIDKEAEEDLNAAESELGDSKVKDINPINYQNEVKQGWINELKDIEWLTRVFKYRKTHEIGPFEIDFDENGFYGTNKNTGEVFGPYNRLYKLCDELIKNIKSNDDGYRRVYKLPEKNFDNGFFPVKDSIGKLERIGETNENQGDWDYEIISDISGEVIPENEIWSTPDGKWCSMEEAIEQYHSENPEDDNEYTDFEWEEILEDEGYNRVSEDDAFEEVKSEFARRNWDPDAGEPDDRIEF